VNVSHVLGEEYISFEEIDDALWQVSVGPVALRRFHEALLRIDDRYGDLARTRRRSAPHLE
jgi:hypothetical protein